MTEDRMALVELLQKSGEADFLRAVAEAVEASPNWWTPLLSSEGSGKVSNEPRTASIYR